MANFDQDSVTYFAEANFRNEKKKFGIKRKDRSKHMYVIGKTGMGKSTLLENMAIQDIIAGEGLGVVDPHGELAEKILSFVPKERIDDVLYFAPHDIDFPIAFNVMEKVDPTQRHLVAAGLLGVFKKIWPDVWSPRMEYILNNCILALLEYPDSTLLGVNRMLADKAYRDDVVSKITDPMVKAFWINEFGKYTDRFATEASAAIQNKVGQFISNPLIRNIIGQTKSSFDFRDLMDQRKIIIMNLSKGKIGEENSRLLGAMLITKIYLAAMSRVDIPESERSDFYLYVDEFQNFATESFKDILSEARKYKLNLTMAHQYIAQMDEKVRDAVFGNVGTLISFRVGAFDGETLETEFAPEFEVQDLVNLGFASVYMRLMIDGVASRPFSASTLPPYPRTDDSYSEEIIVHSREKFASPRERIEGEIAKWALTEEKEEREERAGGPPSRPPMSRSLPHFKEDREVYSAECAVCGKKTYVPFQPDGKAPIYCKNHRPSVAKKLPVEEEKTMPRIPEIRPISLKDLEIKNKPEAKTDELRKILEEIKAERKKEGENTENKGNILKPGEKVNLE